MNFQKMMVWLTATNCSSSVTVLDSNWQIIRTPAYQNVNPPPTHIPPLTNPLRYRQKSTLTTHLSHPSIHQPSNKLSQTAQPHLQYYYYCYYYYCLHRPPIRSPTNLTDPHTNHPGRNNPQLPSTSPPTNLLTNRSSTHQTPWTYLPEKKHDDLVE